MLANPCISGERSFCGSAGLWGSADDYASFVQMLLNGGRAPDGRRLLSKSSVRLMSTNRIGNLFPGIQGISGQGAGFGFGVLVITDHRAAGVALPDGSFGWDGVGTRRFWVIPSQQMVIIMFMPAGKPIAAQRDIETAVEQAVQH